MTKINILFVNPYRPQVVYIESIAQCFLERGDNVFLLSYESWGPTHDNFRQLGAKVYVASKPWLNLPIFRHLSRLVQLVNFCWAQKIDIVYSHYQEANLISVFAQFLCRSRFILTRHHSDCALVDSNYKEKVADIIINRLVKHYIAPSDLVYEQLISVEQIDQRKVIRIDYGYNFTRFNRPEKSTVRAIRDEFNCDLLLVKAARLIPEKRHAVLLETIQQLRTENMNIKLLILGAGPLENQIKEQIAQLHLDDVVHALGFRDDVHNYFDAADLVVHLSESEASNSAIKEAALVATTVAVCENVGDFSDYIVSNKNGFLLERENPRDDLLVVLRKVSSNRHLLPSLGRELKKTVINRFDINHVFPAYIQLNYKILDGKD